MQSKPQQTLPPEQTSDVVYRIAAIDRSGVDIESRSFPIVLATETPVRTFDMARMEIVDEVLRMDGMTFPKQVPMVDSHSLGSVRNVLGSIRELKTVNGELIGRAFFASDEASRQTFQNYVDGHLTDFSVTARRLEATYEGKRKTVTRSALVEGSAVVRGADPNAKALLAFRAYADPDSVRKEVMDSKLRELLVQRGLAADASDAAALEFLSAELKRADHGIDPKLALEAVAKLTPTPKADDKPKGDDPVKLERKRIADIDEACRNHGIEDAVRRKWIDDGVAFDAVARDIVARKNSPAAPITPITVGKESAEKLGEAFAASLTQRMLSAAGKNPQAIADAAKSRGDYDAVSRMEGIAKQIAATPGANEFRYLSIADMARRCLDLAGDRVNGVTDRQVISRAIQHGDYLSRAGGYHTTGSFTSIMLDAQNKLLLASYDDQPVTYPRWVHTAPSVKDFKTIHRVRFGELPNPQVVPEGTEYNESTTSDTRESYAVNKYGDIFSCTMEAMVNDDLGALTRLPAMHGSAMRRTINKACYSPLVANPTMADGVALFHSSSHGANLDATALAESAVDVGFVVMQTQTGLNSVQVLNITPRFLIVPPALASTAYRIVDPRAYPTANTGVKLYSTDAPMTLEVVVDAELSTSQSATLWFLAASPSQVDTVELCFLQGEEAPVMEREEGFATDSIKFKVRQSFGVKAIDYRGLYQGNS